MTRLFAKLEPPHGDAESQREWDAHRDHEARSSVRLGLIAFAAALLLAGPGDAWQAYEGWETVLVIRFVVWAPLMLGGAALVSLPSMQGRVLDTTLAVMVALTLSLIGTMWLVLPRASAIDYPMYWSVLLLLVYVVAPLGFARAMIAGTVVVGGFFIIMTYHHAERHHFAAHTVFIVFAWALLATASWHMDHRAREAFLAQRQLRRLEEQLRQGQKMEALGLFVGGIAHEFNNLLTPILGGIELADRSLDAGHGLRPALADIGRAGARAAELVRQLRALGRRSDLVPRAMDASACVAEVLGLLRPTMDPAITVGFVPTVGNWARADADQIHQVLLNLCINARDAVSGRDGEHPMRIDVTVKRVQFDAKQAAANAGVRTGTWIETEVADTGVGIDPEVIPRLFEPFFTTRNAASGSGLGLAVVHGIVHQHGGWIAVDSVLGEGSRFRFWIPAAEVPSADEAPSAEGHDDGDASVLPPGVPAPCVRRAILVDDEAMVREVTRRLLEHAGYIVEDYPDGHSALARLRSGARPDVLVLDILMPEYDGWQLLTAVRALAPEIPVVMLSGFDIDSDFARGVAPDAFLSKPFRLRGLLEVVDKVIAARKLPT